jgi:hypothetical protein
MTFGRQVFNWPASFRLAKQRLGIGGTMPTTDKLMSPLMRVAFWFVAINALVGGLLLLLFPGRTETLFFWTIRPPISAALFGALYLGGAVAVAAVTRRSLWEPARFLVPILVAAGILLTLTTFLHLDTFHGGISLAYWLVIYIVAPLLAILFYVQHERDGANWAVTGQPITPATRLVAIVTGVLLLLFGAVTLARPELIIAVWPWEISVLMVRVFGSWFSAFGVGLLWVLVERDWTRMVMVANLMIAAAGLDLLMTFIHRDDLKPEPLKVWLFCLHLAAFGFLGLLMHWLQRRGRKVIAAETGLSPVQPTPQLPIRSHRDRG